MTELLRTPRILEFHIAGPSAADYLTPELVSFSAHTESYFTIADKFRETIVAPSGVTTVSAQRLTQKISPTLIEDTNATYKVKFDITVGDNRVLDFGSVMMDIKGTLDRGPSFKPYGGTAYNALAPPMSTVNYTQRWNNQAYYDVCAALNYMNAGNTGGNNPITVARQAATAFMNNVNWNWPSPNIGTQLDPLNTSSLTVGRVLRVDATTQANTLDVSAHGAFYPAKDNEGAQGSGANLEVVCLGETVTVNNQNVEKPLSSFAIDDCTIIGAGQVQYPDTNVVRVASDDVCVRQPNRTNHIGFRDNFIGMLFYDSNSYSGHLSSLASNYNLVADLVDRDTELSYQYWVASVVDRHYHYDYSNQAIDSYDKQVRILSNAGYEDAPFVRSFLDSGRGKKPSNIHVVNIGNWTPLANTEGTLSKSEPFSTCFNLNANIWRNFIYANVCRYLPPDTQLPTDILGTLKRFPARPLNNDNTYAFLNLCQPSQSVVDMFTDIGAKWSPDIMDTVNPFNHHRNEGLKHRSMLLGNARNVQFHIQVPQKFFAIRQLLLCPGRYNYEWYLRKDPNCVLQSTLGNDLRADGASIRYDQVNLFLHYFPLDHAKASQLDLLLRQHNNNQTYADFLHAKVYYTQIPANDTEVQIHLPTQSWGCFRGWSFNRIKNSEYVQQSNGVDPNLKYSGTLPQWDATYYLNHTFQSIAINFETSIPWPGNDRMLNPNVFEIKRNYADDQQNYCVAGSNMTKDWWLVQNLANYNIGYQGFRQPTNAHLNNPYDFIRNYEPMTRQRAVNYPLDPRLWQDGAHVDFSNQIRNNSGFIPSRLRGGANVPAGHPYPANYPPPLIGEVPYASVTEKKFLIDRYTPTIPFSSNFMNMGQLTDLGQSSLYTSVSKSMQLTVRVDPMEVASMLQILFGVFDCARVLMPTRDSLSIYYYRTPFNSAAAAV